MVSKKRPSKKALAAANELLATPERIRATAEALDSINDRLAFVERQLQTLLSRIQPPPGLLTEPAPRPARELLQEDFSHEPKDFP